MRGRRKGNQVKTRSETKKKGKAKKERKKDQVGGDWVSGSGETGMAGNPKANRQQSEIDVDGIQNRKKKEIG